jgi:ABC-2 type transport system permease protein
MKHNPHIVFEIAKWEFGRWFKPKDQLMTLAISLIVGLGIWGGKHALERSARPDAEIVVLNSELLPVAIPPESGLRVRPAAPERLQELRDSVGAGLLDGLLVLKSLDGAELLVYKEPRWKEDLVGYLTGARRQVRIQALGVTPEELTEVFKPFDVQVAYHETGTSPTGTGEKIAAGAVIILMLIGIFLSSAYQFVAITGEKQLRITEQVISAVTPQQWVSGKILGLSFYSFVSSMTFVVAWLIFMGISSFFGDGIAVPVEITRPGILAVVLLLGAGGYLFWNAFFAAIAATINDPNTSTKSPIMFMPILPAIGIAFLALKNPDSLLMKICSLLPVTSPAVLSARLVLTEVALWEIGAALLLLAGGIWLMTVAAGKIFRTGILMYGKEPSLKEIIRWVREE